MEDQDRLAQAVLDFLASETAYPRSKITLDSRVAEDLGVAGDDGDDLMDSFAEKFHVDISSFDFYAHYGDELSPVTGLFMIPFSPKLRKLLRTGLTTIRVRDFVNAAKCGKFSAEHLTDGAENPN
jgi:hypothetical protein